MNDERVLVKTFVNAGRIINFYYQKNTKDVFVEDTQHSVYKKVNVIYCHRKLGEYIYSIELNNKRKTFLVTGLYIKMFLLDFEEYEPMFLWTDELIIKFFKNKYKDNIAPPYNLLSHFNKGTPEKSISLYFRKSCKGVNAYINLLSEHGITTMSIKYRDKHGIMFRSMYEFIFSCFCDINNIKYEYESVKIENRIPDFYIPEINTFFEIVGFSENKSYISKQYSNSLKKKKKIYMKANLKVEFINIKSPIVDIKRTLSKYYDILKIPDLSDYFKFCMCGNQFLESVKNFLTKYNNKEFDVRGIGQKYFIEYDYVKLNYGHIEIAIKQLLDVIPNRAIKRYGKYWHIHENCIFWLEIEKNKYKILPNRTDAKKHKELRQTLSQIYVNYTIEEFKIGGIFHGYISCYADKEMLLKKVIQISTGIIYNSIREAYESTTEYTYNSFVCCLNNLKTNFDFKYY